MSSMGVTSTMTKTNYYYADGTDKGEKVSYSTKGMDQFLQNYTYVDNDGILRDKETGKYAGINQNGTKFTLSRILIVAKSVIPAEPGMSRLFAHSSVA